VWDGGRDEGYLKKERRYSPFLIFIWGEKRGKRILNVIPGELHPDFP
jgi:hypothetical protein